MKFPTLCLMFAATALAQSSITDFIPPQTKVVLGVNVRAIIDSALTSDLSMDKGSLATMMAAQKVVLPIDPLKDVDFILVASTGEGTEPPTLVILRGRFNAQKLTGTAQYHGVPLVDQKDPKNVMVLLDESTLLAGDPVSVQTAIDRRASGRALTQALNPALAAKIASLLSRFDVWGMGDNPKGFQAAKGQAGGLDAVDHFVFGAAFHKGLILEAEAHVRTAQDAQKLSESLKFFETLLSSQKASANGTKFNLSTQNGTLKLAIEVPEEELKKAIAAQKVKIAAMAPKPQPKPTDPKDVQIIKNANGDTIQVILPGGH